MLLSPGASAHISDSGSRSFMALTPSSVTVRASMSITSTSPAAIAKPVRMAIVLPVVSFVTAGTVHPLPPAVKTITG